MSRTQEIAGHILNILNGWDGELADEAVIHAQVNNRVIPAALLSEFHDAIEICQQAGWITGVMSPLRGTRWAITDKGRATRHQ